VGCGSGGPIPQMSFHSSSQAAGADSFFAVLLSGRGQKYRAEGCFFCFLFFKALVCDISMLTIFKDKLFRGPQDYY